MALTWTQKGSLRGPAGAKGDAGDPGATGAGYRTCSVTLTADSDVDTSNITPSAGLQIGDLLVDPTGAVFPVASVGEGTAHTGAATGQNLRGPQGQQGEPGQDGEDGTGVNIKGAVSSSSELPGTGEAGDAYITNDTGNLWVWDVGQSKYVDTGAQVKGPKGDTGAAGAAATVTVGTTQTGEAGTSAQVTNSGSESAAVFNFTIPKGEKGDTGAAGPGVTVGNGVPSEPGQAGALYIDADTGNMYSYEETE